MPRQERIDAMFALTFPYYFLLAVYIYFIFILRFGSFKKSIERVVTIFLPFWGYKIEKEVDLKTQIKIVVKIENYDGKG